MRTVDSRVARFDQGVAALALLCGFVFAVPSMIPLLAVLQLMSAVHPAVSPVPRLFETYAAPRLAGPPRPEEAAPWRAASFLHAVLLGAGTLLLAIGDRSLAWAFGLPAAALAALSSVGGLCVGCQLYARRRGA